MFLRDCWYVAAWGRDVEHKLTPHTILGERVVLYRQKNGQVVALEDACPHRKLPLSMGRLQDAHVECGYHGLVFDCSGKCVAAPTQGAIPPSAAVKSYPVAERFGFVWIWMGDADKADTSKIFNIENFDNASWGTTKGGALEINCHYLWITDNLLDPSHVAWVHQTSFAAPGTDSTPLETQLFDDGVIVSRWIYDQPQPPYYKQFVDLEGNCDRLQHYEVRVPSVCINKSIFTPPGTGGDANILNSKAFVVISYNFMTPIDADRTMYFWFQHRNKEAENQEIDQLMNDGAIFAFNEDRVILEGVHQGMKHKTSPHLNLGIDAGSLRYRKLLQTAIDRERAE